MEILAVIGRIAGFIVFAALGFAQLAAGAEGILHLTGWHIIVSALLALFAVPMPIIGQGIVYIGARNAWGWEMLPSILLAGGWVLLIAIGSALLPDRAMRRRI